VVLSLNYHRGSNMQQKNKRLIEIKPFSCFKKSSKETLKRIFLVMALAGFCTLPACSTAPQEGIVPVITSQSPEQKTEQVSIRPDDYDTGMIYSIQNKDCRIEWITRNNEVGVIKHCSHCPASLSEQLPLLTQLCAAYLSKDKNAKAFRALFWGRLLPDEMPGPPELSMRLALAAHKSPGWDAKRGRAKNGHDYELARDLANNEMIYPELKELFAYFNKTITVSYMEKLCILQAKELPYFEQLKQHGVKAEEKLPFDAATWFSIKDASKK